MKEENKHFPVVMGALIVIAVCLALLVMRFFFDENIGAVPSVNPAGNVEFPLEPPK